MCVCVRVCVSKGGRGGADPMTLSTIEAATHCNALQRTATHCNTLQHTATHCNTLQLLSVGRGALTPRQLSMIKLQHTATEHYEYTSAPVYTTNTPPIHYQHTTLFVCLNTLLIHS